MGLFITIDGPNGAGKSTLINTLAKELFENNKKIQLTKEPTNSKLGTFIRSLEGTVRGKALACLVTADRIEHLEHEIEPALKENKIVLCDRYILSTLALQQLDGVSEGDIWFLQKDLRRPDLSVLLSGNAHTIRQRLEERNTLTFFEKKFTSQEEVNAFEKSVSFLEKKGFEIMKMDCEKEPSVLSQVLYTKIITLLK